MLLYHEILLILKFFKLIIIKIIKNDNIVIIYKQEFILPILIFEMYYQYNHFEQFFYTYYHIIHIMFSFNILLIFSF